MFRPGEEPLGKRLRSLDPAASTAWRPLVGVVPNIMLGDALRQRFKPLVYVPFEQEPALRRIPVRRAANSDPAVALRDE